MSAFLELRLLLTQQAPNEVMIFTSLIAISALASSSAATAPVAANAAPAISNSAPARPAATRVRSALPAARPRPDQGRLRTKRMANFGGLLQQGQGSAGLTMGGNFTSARSGPMISVQSSPSPGVYQIMLNDPGTGWQESVLLGVPSTQILGPKPLLVMFHGANISEWDCYINGVDMFEGARDRGWYVLAPLGAHQLNFGIPYSQANIEYALSLFVDLLPIDDQRIYGVGFSMGGGTMMTYASRHHDLNKPRFAALTNHTGAVSVAFVYSNSQSTATFDNPLMFNGSPTDFPFLYSQSSSLDIDHNSLGVDPTTDLLRNLVHVPTLNYHADFDPHTNLILATETLFSRLSQMVGAETYLLTPSFSEHDWSTMDENTSLNYMGSKTLQTPTEGTHRMLADREANWLHFYVYQDHAGAFTPFRWNMDSAANRLDIDQTANLQRMVVNTTTIGLDTTIELQLAMAATDGPNEITTLTGYSTQPLEVLRNGVPTASWTWNVTGEVLTLWEFDATTGAVWTVRP